MAAGEEVKKDNDSGCGVLYHGLDDVPYHSLIDVCAEDMGSL